MTLIELMIALAVAVVLFSAAVMGIGAITGARAKKSAGELAGTIRALYDTAALTGRTCRLAFELPGEKAEDQQVRYRAECAAGAVTTSADRDEALQTERRAREEAARELGRERGRTPSRSSWGDEATLEELMSAEQGRVEQATRFSEYTSPEISPRELPDSVRVGVWTRGQQHVARNGPAYLYFFPQGVTERAMVYLTQGDDTWTLTVAPLTGKVTVVPRELEVPSR
jgi:general secretion pathway protein H